MPLLNTADALYMADREASHAFLGANRVFTNLELAIQKLFAAGEQGVWFDNSDLTTLFEDSGGTTAASVNGLVGLQLDKGHADGRGVVNRVIHSNVFDTSGWGRWNSTITAGAATGPGDVGSMHQLADDATNSYHTIYSATAQTLDGSLYTRSVIVKRGTARYVAFGVASTLGTSAGNTWIFDFDTGSFTAVGTIGAGQQIEALGEDTYRISWTNVATSGFNNRVCVGISAGPNYNDASYVGTGALTVYIAKAQYELGSTFTSYQANGAVVGGPGNHRYQTTTAAKPILRGTPVGGNILTNGDFSAGSTGWSLGTGWSVASGVATHVGGTPEYLKWEAGIVVGRVYRMIFTVTAITSGASVSIYFGQSPSVFTTTTAGTFVAYGTAIAGTLGFAIRGNSSNPAHSVSVDNIEVHDVTADVVTAPYFLKYDGVDDFLQTAEIDFTGTDKMTVVAGLRKLSDAAAAIAMELGASFNTLGGVGIFAPGNASPTIYYNTTTSGGVRATAQYSNASVAAPVTVVVTGQSDISSDLCILRINAAQVANMTVDQGVGTYRNLPIYMGRRAGTSLPFNGHEYQLIVRGAQSSASQIDDAEALTAQRTGVSLA